MSFTPRPFNSLHRLSLIRSLRVPQTFGHRSPSPSSAGNKNNQGLYFNLLLDSHLGTQTASEWLRVKHPMNVVRLSAGARNFIFFKTTRPTNSPVNLLLNWYRRPVVKRSGVEFGYSSPFSPEAKNECRYTSIPPYAFTV